MNSIDIRFQQNEGSNFGCIAGASTARRCLFDNDLTTYGVQAPTLTMAYCTQLNSASFTGLACLCNDMDLCNSTCKSQSRKLFIVAIAAVAATVCSFLTQV